MTLLSTLFGLNKIDDRKLIYGTHAIPFLNSTIPVNDFQIIDFIVENKTEIYAPFTFIKIINHSDGDIDIEFNQNGNKNPIPANVITTMDLPAIHNIKIHNASTLPITEGKIKITVMHTAISHDSLLQKLLGG